MAATDSARRSAADKPMLLRLEAYAELSIFAGSDDRAVVLQFNPPTGGAVPLFETKLTVEKAAMLIDRLVHAVAEIRGRPREPGAGLLSSTF
jgi:hypothetical protein